MITYSRWLTGEHRSSAGATWSECHDKATYGANDQRAVRRHRSNGSVVYTYPLQGLDFAIISCERGDTGVAKLVEEERVIASRSSFTLHGLTLDGLHGLHLDSKDIRP